MILIQAPTSTPVRRETDFEYSVFRHLTCFDVVLHPDWTPGVGMAYSEIETEMYNEFGWERGRNAKTRQKMIYR